jgi:hypothetical protein
MQRAPDVAPGKGGIGILCPSPGALLIQGDDRMQCRIVPGDLCEMVFQHLSGGYPPLTNACGQFLHGGEDQIVHGPFPLACFGY